MELVLRLQLVPVEFYIKYKKNMRIIERERKKNK
jgi:hypothetical protein